MFSDVKCSKLYPTPYSRIDCPYGYRTGFFCNISCDAGKTLFGSDFVVCDKSNQGLFGAWNWEGGHQTVCESKHILYVANKMWFVLRFLNSIKVISQRSVPSLLVLASSVHTQLSD